ncbi:hypothetical protein [Rheinheimera lutimaris]|uniref:hypothetical protein n=1 Tax=Rheinheimera lutimaris TaxID=2740584 RepID=UPI001C49A0F3|nr:hypothetical protein [Rheinheimera lutimaris]
MMVSTIPVASIQSISPWIFFLGYFASCFLGVYLFTKSDSPLVSFIGYNFVVVPFGLIINIAVSRYDPDLVVEAIKITGVVTGITMVLGALFPKFFARISGALTISLLIVIDLATSSELTLRFRATTPITPASGKFIFKQTRL